MLEPLWWWETAKCSCTGGSTTLELRLFGRRPEALKVSDFSILELLRSWCPAPGRTSAGFRPLNSVFWAVAAAPASTRFSWLRVNPFLAENWVTTLPLDFRRSSSTVELAELSLRGLSSILIPSVNPKKYQLQKSCNIMYQSIRMSMCSLISRSLIYISTSNTKKLWLHSVAYYRPIEGL